MHHKANEKQHDSYPSVATIPPFLQVGYDYQTEWEAFEILRREEELDSL